VARSMRFSKSCLARYASEVARNVETSSEIDSASRLIRPRRRHRRAASILANLQVLAITLIPSRES